MPKDKTPNSQQTSNGGGDNVVYFDFKKAQAVKTPGAGTVHQHASDNGGTGGPGTTGISPGKLGPQPVVESEESIAQWLRDYCEQATEFLRFQRAKTYVEQGRVRHFTSTTGFVAAAVKGTQNEPFQVSISFPKRSGANAAELREYLSAAPEHLTAARRGRLRLSEIQNLFVNQYCEELTASCNCPDRPDFCKHVSAVLLHFADLIADDPALAFGMRGIVLADIQLRVSPRQAVIANSDAPASHRQDATSFWLGDAFPDLPEAHPVDFFRQADELYLREALKSVSALPIEQIRAFADLEEIYDELMHNQAIQQDEFSDDVFSAEDDD